MQVPYWELDCLSLSALRKSDWGGVNISEIIEGSEKIFLG